MARKLPLLEPTSSFFWTAGERGRLEIQRCDDCGRYQHPPMPRCASCGSERLTATAVSGRGRIASFTVNHEPWLPGLAVPFVFAVVELVEQAELYVFTNIRAAVDAVAIGLPVTVAFERRDDVYLPMFDLAESHDGG